MRPKIRLWQPGDVLLFRAVKPGWAQKKIAQVQRDRLKEENRRNKGSHLWTHAAVYIGPGKDGEPLVCHSTKPFEEVIESVKVDLGGYRIRAKMWISQLRSHGVKRCSLHEITDTMAVRCLRYKRVDDLPEKAAHIVEVTLAELDHGYGTAAALTHFVRARFKRLSRIFTRNPTLIDKYEVSRTHTCSGLVAHAIKTVFPGKMIGGRRVSEVMPCDLFLDRSFRRIGASKPVP